MFVVTAGCDPLTDDCIAFAERVKVEGGEVEYYPVPGMVHGFFTLGKLFPQANAAVREAAESLRRT